MESKWNQTYTVGLLYIVQYARCISGFVAKWIKAVAFGAMKLSSREVWGDSPLDQSEVGFSSKSSLWFSHLNWPFKKRKKIESK